MQTPAAKEFHLTNQSEYGTPDFYQDWENAFWAKGDAINLGFQSYEGRGQYQFSDKNGHVAVVGQQGEYYGLLPDLFHDAPQATALVQPVVDIEMAQLFGGSVPLEIGGYDVTATEPLPWERIGLANNAG